MSKLLYKELSESVLGGVFRKLNGTMEAQLINYLRLSKVPVGYLINFRNERVEWKRRVVSSSS